MKILIIGPSWVGDMVMSQSLYMSLKAQHPNATIDVLAPAWCCSLLERMPEVNRAITMPVGHGELMLGVRFKLARELAKENYDWAIVQPNSLKSALIPVFAGIKKRTGWKGETRYGLLNDIRTNKNDFPLMVERYDALAYPKAMMRSHKDIPNIPYPKLIVDKNNQQQALQQLNLNTTKKILTLCPGAEFGPSKRWPDYHYAAVAKYMIELGWQVWVFGSNKDTEVGDAIKQHLPKEQQASCFNLAGTTTLHQAIDLMALSDLVVTNDSGLMHVAAAVERPLVAVYGSTSPEYTPPLAEKIATEWNNDIDCRPCFKRVCPLGHNKCMTELYPQQIIAAITRLISL